jgi:AcrR family transcriptional regulator
MFICRVIVEKHSLIFDLLNKLVNSVVIFAVFILNVHKNNMKLPVRSHVEKAEVILETAQKRFALYGIEKTTMREIAGDLNMTKGSLYYYFPDKENLYKAVIEKEQAEFTRVLQNDLKNNDDPVEAMKKYVRNRLSYFKTMVNLSRMRAESFSEYKPLITDSMKKFRENEMKVIIEFLNTGKSRGIFSVDDTTETASLFLDLLRGLRSAVLTDKKLLVIDDDEFRIMADKTMKFTMIFINGIRKK